MVTLTHPETYLRLAYERILRNAGDQQIFQMIGEPLMGARALIASGVLQEATARAAVDEYALAFEVREGTRRLAQFFRGGMGAGQSLTLSAARVVMGDFAVGDVANQLRLHQVIFADDATYLDMSGVSAGNVARQSAAVRAGVLRRGNVAFPHGGPSRQSFVVTDDQGGQATANQGRSSSSPKTWEATFVTDKALSATTAWIEVDGERLDLPPPSPTPPARVEDGDPRPMPQAALYDELAAALTQRHGGDPSIEGATRALVETGALAPTDPLLVEVNAIAAALGGGPSGTALGQPWASLLRRWASSDGPVGRAPIGAVVGPVDGYAIRFDSLASDQGGFSVALATSPGDAFGQQGPFPGFDLPPIQWWAEDDRHNAYLGMLENHSASPDLAQGTLRFSGPLDPEAHELRLLPRGRSQKGVVTMALDALTGRS